MTSRTRTGLWILVWHVDAQFGRRHKVFARTLGDHHTRLLMKHGRDFRHLVDGQFLGHIGVLVVQVVRYVAILPQEGEEFEKKLAEVFANAKPPWYRGKGERKSSSQHWQRIRRTYFIGSFHFKQIWNKWFALIIRDTDMFGRKCEWEGNKSCPATWKNVSLNVWGLFNHSLQIRKIILVMPSLAHTAMYLES